MFEELLDNIVSKNILHQLQAVLLDFPEYLVFLIAVRGLQFLLNEARAMLISAKFNDEAIKFLQLYATIGLRAIPEIHQLLAHDGEIGRGAGSWAGRGLDWSKPRDLHHRRRHIRHWYGVGNGIPKSIHALQLLCGHVLLLEVVLVHLIWIEEVAALLLELLIALQFVIQDGQAVAICECLLSKGLIGIEVIKTRRVGVGVVRTLTNAGAIWRAVAMGWVKIDRSEGEACIVDHADG